ncbi:MAG: hypothetical protein Q4P29_07975 [Tissierellia bacterium]|nr:hypothetical protein [Tissierellia bacterium]
MANFIKDKIEKSKNDQYEYYEKQFGLEDLDEEIKEIIKGDANLFTGINGTVAQNFIIIKQLDMICKKLDELKKNE